MATAGQRANIRRMNAARAAKRELRAREAEARSAVEADNPIDIDDEFVDEVPTPPTRFDRVAQTRARAPIKPRVLAKGRVAAKAKKAGKAKVLPPRRNPTVVSRTTPAVMRDPVTGRVMARGRDGKMITRRVSHSDDQFHIAKEDIPDGWSYQWIAHTILGAEQRNSKASFKMGGWEPVSMERYEGRYGPAGETGPIIIEGLMLCERPAILTEEARSEEVQAARDLIRTRNDQFSPKLPEARRRRGTELRAKRTIEGMPPDVARPSYQVDVDEGLV